MRKLVLFALLLVVALTFVGKGSASAEKFELKIAHFTPSTYFFAKYLANWAKELEQKSNGRLVFKVFPGCQMGPPNKYFDLGRKGVADIVWFMHGTVPGRFLLTGLIELPYMVPSAEVGNKVLNHPDVLDKYLAKEHTGLKVLYLNTHQPGHIHTRKKPVRTTEDLKGLRIRHPSSIIKHWLTALGGTPVGIPPNQMSDALQKGTIDGVFIDYGGAHLAWRLGKMLDYTTEIYSYVASFAVCMNQRSYEKLPKDLQQLIVTSTSNVAEIGKIWDAADAPGKAYLIREGVKIIHPSPEENLNFKRIAKTVVENRIVELEKKGLPARAVFNKMKELSDEYAKTSNNFWN